MTGGQEFNMLTMQLQCPWFESDGNSKKKKSCGTRIKNVCSLSVLQSEPTGKNITRTSRRSHFQDSELQFKGVNPQMGVSKVYLRQKLFSWSMINVYDKGMVHRSAVC